jgi:hypothetical protein
MNRKLLVLSVAALALAATGASAKTHKHHHGGRMAEGGKYAAPAQPIPYAELDSYVGGSHRGKMAAGGTTDAQPSSPPSTPPAAAPPPQ